VAVEAIKNLPVVAVSCSRLIHDYDIEPFERSLVLAKRLPNEPLDAVPAGRRLTVFLGDREAKACRPTLVRSTQNGEQLVPAAMCLFEHAAESRSIQ